jgi:hypothetical protein
MRVMKKIALLTANRSRPLCPYPQYAHYNGSGDPEDAASFSCREP